MMKRMKIGLMAAVILLAGASLMALSKVMLSQLTASVTSAAPVPATPVCSLSLVKKNSPTTLIYGSNTLLTFTVKTGNQPVQINSFGFDIQKTGNFTISQYQLVDKNGIVLDAHAPLVAAGVAERFGLSTLNHGLIAANQSLTLMLKADVSGALTGNILSANMDPYVESICAPTIGGLPVNGTPLVY